jgi:hypothetical protein
MIASKSSRSRRSVRLYVTLDREAVFLPGLGQIVQGDVRLAAMKP